MALKFLKVKTIHAREILDSRGRPTLEVELQTSAGNLVVASVPAGASRGSFEAFELRDNNHKQWGGLGVSKAVANVNHVIAPKIKNKIFKSLLDLDNALLKIDPTKQKSKLGGNSILSVSLAAAKGFAADNKLPLYRYFNQAYGLGTIDNLPSPMMNIFNGGKHADTNLDVQELMIVPQRKRLLSEKIRMGVEIFHALGDVLKSSGYDTDTGDEGGYAPDIHATTEAIRAVLLAIRTANYVPGKDVMLAFDVGANTMFDEHLKQYRFKLDAIFYSAAQLITLYEAWNDQFPILSIEDGLAEEDWSGWAKMTERLGSDLLIIGDDLFVSNVARLRQGIKTKAANAILIKPNQIGTISETVATIKLAQDNNIKVIVSHRSGETNDDLIADFAVGVKADYVKFGAPNRGERVAKYNRLMFIEEELIRARG